MTSNATRVAVIGAGFMGTAILQGLLQGTVATNEAQQYKYSACVRSSASVDRLKTDLATFQDQVETGYGPETAARMAADAKIIILGVAPGDLKATLQTPDIVRALKSKVVISVLAGTSLQQLEEEVKASGGSPDHCTFVRLLPTLGCRIGESVSMIADPVARSTNSEDLVIAETLFKRLGGIAHVPEPLMNEVTALGAVAHALAITSVDTLADAAAADGVPRPIAEKIAAQCLRSASSLFLSGMSPAEMKSAMAVPTGITINAILDLDRAARPAIAEAERKAVAHTNRMAG